MKDQMIVGEYRVNVKVGDWTGAPTDEYIKCTKSRFFLNSLLDCNFKNVYRLSKSTVWKEDSCSYGAETFYVVTSKDKVVRFINSEWASIGVEK